MATNVQAQAKDIDFILPEQQTLRFTQTYPGRGPDFET